jgi:hypothetical protein
MHYDWILDVLTDLRAFAVTNGLTVLAEQLDDTSIIAASEIARSKGVSGRGSAANADTVGAFYRMPSASKNA